MTRKIQIIACLAVATLAAPAVTRADHRHQGLLPASERLHQSIIAFEQVASTRPLPRHEKHYIHLMTRHACRLVDGLKCSAVWGRVVGDHAVLRSFVRTVNRRLERNCALRYDTQLQQTWQCVLRDFEAVTCRIESPGSHHQVHTSRRPYAAHGSAPGFGSPAAPYPYSAGPGRTGFDRGPAGIAAPPFGASTGRDVRFGARATSPLAAPRGPYRGAAGYPAIPAGHAGPRSQQISPLLQLVLAALSD